VTGRVPSRTDWYLLSAVTLGAIGVHGYHPATEDAERYTPGILKALHPSLFPYNAQFFESHAKLTLFPNLIAASVRATHLPMDVALLAWHILSVFMFFVALWRIARLCFDQRHAVWCGIALVGALLSIPVAGTALYIMDPYLTTRSLSTPFALFAVANTLEDRYVAAAVWILLTALIHPLMVVFAGAYIALLILLQWRISLTAPSGAVATAFSQQLFPPVTAGYREVLRTQYTYFFLGEWRWYEWIGLLAPFGILVSIKRAADRLEWQTARLVSRGLLWFGVIFCAAALVTASPARFANYAELQPLRYLHLLYILMFLLAGGFLGAFLLKQHAWRWALLFVPLCAGMSFAQQQIMPATPHLEWPGRATGNAWVRAFDWIRENTPENAYFALDPAHMALTGEDEHGFRAIAERSRLADEVNDSGAVSMFPALTAEWSRQVNAQRGWRQFGREDLVRLNKMFAVDWVVLEQPGIAGLTCPYSSRLLLVCRIVS
jgi:hypothetical protein